MVNGDLIEIRSALIALNARDIVGHRILDNFELLQEPVGREAEGQDPVVPQDILAIANHDTAIAQAGGVEQVEKPRDTLDELCTLYCTRYSV